MAASAGTTCVASAGADWLTTASIVRKFQELLGHASLSTTLRYFNTSTQAVGDAINKAMGW